MLIKDVEFLKLRYRLDAKGKSEGRLILRSLSSRSEMSFQLTFCLIGTSPLLPSTRQNLSRRCSKKRVVLSSTLAWHHLGTHYRVVFRPQWIVHAPSVSH